MEELIIILISSNCNGITLNKMFSKLTYLFLTSVYIRFLMNSHHPLLHCIYLAVFHIHMCQIIHRVQDEIISSSQNASASYGQ